MISKFAHQSSGSDGVQTLDSLSNGDGEHVGKLWRDATNDHSGTAICVLKVTPVPGLDF